MSYADVNARLLEGHLKAIKAWCEIFFSDSASIALDLRAKIVDEDLLELRRIRWFSLASGPELEKLWTRYVERSAEEDPETRESLMDFVMNGASYMALHNAVSDADSKSFIAHLAQTISWPHRSPLTPKHMKEYTTDMNAVSTMLTDNHWVVFLFLLAWSDLK